MIVLKTSSKLHSILYKNTGKIFHGKSPGKIREEFREEFWMEFPVIIPFASGVNEAVPCFKESIFFPSWTEYCQKMAYKYFDGNFESQKTYSYYLKPP